MSRLEKKYFGYIDRIYRVSMTQDFFLKPEVHKKYIQSFVLANICLTFTFYFAGCRNTIYSLQV